MISVIIPFCNAEKYIVSTIFSVLKQTYQDFEIICVDNNSIDSSRKQVEKLIQEFPSKIYLFDEKKKGANYARNLGIKKSKGEIIQFLDADDILVETKFEKQIIPFLDYTVSMVVSDRITMDEALENVIEKHNFSNIESYPLNTMISSVVITGNPLYRKSFIEKMGAWNEALPNAQDWELNIRAVLEGANIKYVLGVFLISRSVKNSLSYNWLNVSNTCANVLIKNYGIIANHKEKLNEKSISKIFFIFYLSAIHSKENEKEYIDFIIHNIPFWKKYLVFIKRLYAQLFGLQKLIRFEKKIAK